MPSGVGAVIQALGQVDFALRSPVTLASFLTSKPHFLICKMCIIPRAWDGGEENIYAHF